MATTTLTPAASRYSALYEWLTTTDHKKIGIMYIVNSFIFFFIGGLLALGVRTELAQPGLQFVTAADLQRTVHDARDVHDLPVRHPDAGGLRQLRRAAPDRRAGHGLPADQRPVASGCCRSAGVLLLLGFVTGGTAAAGWTSYAPLSEDRPLAAVGAGQDLWIVALVLIGTSSILGAINFLVTIFKMRAPGMTLFRMPIMVWTMLVTSVLVLMATPVITSALIMLFIDRNYGGAFFDPSRGGDAILYQNIFWFYSHPAVYVMILPAMGMVSEILPVFSRKPLFGYKAFIFATAAIGALGFSVWAHHMFTTGAVYLPFFSIMTFLIAVPTGVKMFNWVFTMWRGQLMLKTPLLFALGFLTMFLIGGINGAFTRLGAGRLRAPRHLLGRRPPALRAVRRIGLRGHGRLLLLVPQDDRPDDERDHRQGAVRAHVHRLQHDLLPDARAGPGRACRGASPTTPRPRAGTT